MELYEYFLYGFWIFVYSPYRNQTYNIFNSKLESYEAGVGLLAHPLILYNFIKLLQLGICNLRTCPCLVRKQHRQLISEMLWNNLPSWRTQYSPMTDEYSPSHVLLLWDVVREYHTPCRSTPTTITPGNVHRINKWKLKVFI